tara:strand:+ start:341 stop:931 length:591 start_codon:yes stop_codon:yes gene_type:complete
METKLIILDIGEDDQLDFQIAKVDRPAIESNWQIFNDQRRYSFADKEKRIVQGYFMIADLPIYRRDANGEYYVKFTKDSIMNIVQNFMRNGLTKNVNEDHQTNVLSEDVFVLESWIIDSARGTTAPKGFESIDGSWFGSMKINNDEIWEKIKNGDFSGFSVEGDFIPTAELNSDDKILEAVKRIIKKEVEVTSGKV